MPRAACSRGECIIECDGMRVRAAMVGIFGIGASAAFWMGFVAFAVDRCRPFLSESGYRSFLGCSIDLAPGVMPDVRAATVIRHYVAHELKGRLKTIAVRPAR